MHKRKHCPKSHQRALFSSSKELLCSCRAAGVVIACLNSYQEIPSLQVTSPITQRPLTFPPMTHCCNSCHAPFHTDNVTVAEQYLSAHLKSCFWFQQHLMQYIVMVMMGLMIILDGGRKVHYSCVSTANRAPQVQGR